MRLTHTRLHALLLFFITAALCTAVAADDPEPATISGTVLEAGSGSPVADAIVVVTASGPPESFVSDPTDSSGGFSLEVPMGNSDTERDILVEAASPAHAPGRYNGAPEVKCFFGCGGFDGQFQVEAGQAVDNVDFDLEPGGRIAGTITETASGSALENAHIQLIHQSAPSSRTRWSNEFRPATDSSGAYETELALPAGEFFVLAVPPLGANFVTQAWQGHACQLAQLGSGVGHGCAVLATDSLEVTAGAVTSAIDFALKPGARIEGTRNPDINTQVWLFNAAGQPLDYRWLFDGSGDEWSFQGLAGGSYYLQFGPMGGDPHVRVLHNGLPCPVGGCERARGEPLSVAPASTLSGVDVTLELGGQLEGSLIDGDSGTTPPFEPVQWASRPVATLDIIDGDGQVVGGATVLDDDGELKLQSTFGIPEGDYFVRTFHQFFGHGVGYNQIIDEGHIPGYTDAIYDGQPCVGRYCDLTAATPVTFEAGQTTDITLEITTGSDIAGSVVDDSSEQPIAAATVKLINSENQTLAATFTDMDGEFSFGAFPAGDYYLRTGMASQVGPGSALPAHAYFDRVYGSSENCSEKLCDPATGDVISLDGDNDAGPLALRVEPGPVISGRVIDELTGDIINGGSVEVYDEEENLVGSYRINRSSARYQTTALPPGTYTLVPVVSPAFQATTQSSEPTVSSVRTTRGTRTGSVSVTIGTESVEADMTVVDRSLDVIFHSGFEP